jgi:hypothetical protein
MTEPPPDMSGFKMVEISEGKPGPILSVALLVALLLFVGSPLILLALIWG